VARPRPGPAVGGGDGARGSSRRFRRHHAATELAEPAHFVAGQYYLVRMRVDVVPGVLEQAYSVSSSPWPPSSEIEITVRDVPGGRTSRVLARQVREGDQLHLHGPFGALTWNEADGGPLLMIGAGGGVAPFASIVRFASVRIPHCPNAPRLAATQPLMVSAPGWRGVATSSNVWSSLTCALLMNRPTAVWRG
jgi:hypothetical protein